MNSYLIDPRKNGGDQFTIDADDIGEAAGLAAKEILKKSHLQIHRQTGDAEGSGMFAAYEQARTSEYMLNSYGCPFHVMELRAHGNTGNQNAAKGHDTHLNIRVPVSSKAAWVKAAQSLQGRTLTEWVIQALDRAAE